VEAEAEAGSGSWKRKLEAEAGSGSWKRKLEAEAGSGSWKRKLEAEAVNGSWKRSFLCESRSVKILPLPHPHKLFDLQINLAKKFCPFPNVD